MSDIKKLKLAELKKELADRGLNTKGKKDELVQRLQEFLDAGGDDDLNAAEEPGVGEEDEGDIEEGGDEILEGDEEEDEVAKALIAEEDNTGEGEEETVEKEKPELEERHQVTTVVTKRIKITAPATDSERKKLRAEKFHTPLPDEDRKAARAKRFGDILTNESTEKSSIKTTLSSDADILKKRALRFGANVAPAAKKVEEREKLLKRKQRFGGIVSTTGSTDTEAKKKMRAERFGVA